MKFYIREINSDKFPGEISLTYYLYDERVNTLYYNSDGTYEIKDEDVVDIDVDGILSDVDKFNAELNADEQITCIGFIGGDAHKRELVQLCLELRAHSNKLHLGWWSDDDIFPLRHGVFDYIKLGRFEDDSVTLYDAETKQRYYANMEIDHPARNIISAKFADMTAKLFWINNELSGEYYNNIDQLDKSEKGLEKETSKKLDVRQGIFNILQKRR